MRLTFSFSTTAPTVSAPSRYQIDTIAATLICCDECPSPHQMSRYTWGSTFIMSSDHRKVGM